MRGVTLRQLRAFALLARTHSFARTATTNQRMYFDMDACVTFGLTSTHRRSSGSFLVTGNQDGTVHAYDLRTLLPASEPARFTQAH